MPRKMKSTTNAKTTRKPVTVKKESDAAKSAKSKDDSGVFAKLAKKAGKGAAKGAAKGLLK